MQRLSQPQRVTMKLTKKREAYVGKFKPTMIKGSPLAIPTRVADKYAKSLQKITKEMTAYTIKEIRKLYATPHAQKHFGMDASIASQSRMLVNALNKKFDDMFGAIAKPLATQMVDGVNQASKSSLAQSTKVLSGGMSIKTNIMGEDLHQTVKASVAQNAMLIKSIPQQYLDKVGGAVMRSITTGQGLEELLPIIEKFSGETERRAENIALDQTRKAYNTINRDRMKKVGIEKFIWRHSAGGKNPREDHLELDGQVFSFDDLPVIDSSTGERGIPGQAINCKCFMEPVIVFDDNEKE